MVLIKGSREVGFLMVGKEREKEKERAKKEVLDAGQDIIRR